MKSTVTLCSCILGLLGFGNSSPYNGGFKSATITQFPYFASIEVNGTYNCAATIIDDKYVMTTYSCVKGMDAKWLGVRVGTSKQGHRGVYFKVLEYTSWHGNPFIGPPVQVDYDIAMVKIAVSFTYNPHVMWANPNADGIVELMEGSLVGWANTKKRGSPLLTANAYVLASSNCSEIYSGVMNISESMYCLWPSDPNISPCFADMGAPFFLNEQYYGTVTHAPGCDQPDMPIVITGVAKFTSFIIMVLCDMADIFGGTAPKTISQDSASQLLSRQSLMAM